MPTLSTMFRPMRQSGLLLAAATGVLWGACPNVLALTFPLPPPSESVVGIVKPVAAQYADTLLDLARKFDVGYEEIRLANPGVDTWLPGEGTRVVIPTRFVLPAAPREGIVINLAEFRLYFYPRPGRGESPVVITFPIGIGREGWRTPQASTRVASKQARPTWVPPASIRAEHAASGIPLPVAVPPGPDNPLGEYVLRLALPSYSIHGTNRPHGVGMEVSHGCIRLYPEDIATLFPLASVGTPVRIIDQPVKAGWRGEVLFVEAHPRSIVDQRPTPANLTQVVRSIVRGTSDTRAIDWIRVRNAVASMRGIPVAVSRPGPPRGAPQRTLPHSSPPGEDRRGCREHATCPDGPTFASPF